MNLEPKKETTLLMTVIILSLKDPKVPVNNSDSAVIRDYENKTVFRHFKISKRGLVARNLMCEHKILCGVNYRIKFKGRIT